LAAIVGEHLFGRFELGDGLAIDLDHGLRGGTAEQIGADDETGVIIQEGDDVGVTAAQPEGEDVRLPHLIGRGPFEETGPREVALFRRRLLGHQTSLVQLCPDRFGAGRKEEHPAQPLRDAFDTEGGIFLFELDDFAGNSGREFGLAQVGRGVGFESFFALLIIDAPPARESLLADACLFGNEPAGKTFLQIEPDDLELELERIPAVVAAGSAARNPPGGVDVLLLYWLISFFIMHGNTPFNSGVSTIYPLILVS
jgi:hypothetical protein